MKNRNEIPLDKTWDLSKIYLTDADWEADFLTLDRPIEELNRYRLKLSNDPSILAEVLNLRDQLSRKINKLYVYAHLKADQDTTNTDYMGMQGRIQSKAVQMGASLSWIDPEILDIPDAQLATYKKSPALKPYLWAMELLLRQKPHTLTAREEGLLTQASDPLSSIHKIFGMLNNADMRFPNTVDENGKSVELTHGNYVKFLENPNRNVRKTAFESLFSSYSAHKNTFAAILEGQVKNHAFQAKAHHFNSSLEASLFEDNVPKSVYDGLIQAVNQNLPIFHRYIKLRKKNSRTRSIGHVRPLCAHC